jgi:hypothetical protein
MLYGCDSLPVRRTRKSKTPVLCSLCSSRYSAASSQQQPASPPTATQHQPSPKAQDYPHCASYHRHSKRVAKRPTFLPVSRNCLRPSDPRLCYSSLPKILSCLPARRVLCFVISHPQPATPACFLSPRQFPGRLVPPRKHFLLGSATPFPELYNLLLRQGSALPFWYFHTTAIWAPALRFRILPVLAKTPT